jgi:hypothetical protein
LHGKVISGKYWSKRSSAGKTTPVFHVALSASKISLDIHSEGITAELAGGLFAVTQIQAVPARLD